MKSEIVFSGKYNYVNRILEINSLNDAKYYIFVITISNMLRNDCANNDLVSIVHSDENAQEIRIKAANACIKGVDFEKFMIHSSGEFYYLADNINKNTNKLYEGKYIFHIKDNINVTIINE